MKSVNGAQRSFWPNMVPLESQMQQAFVDWCAVQENRYPELKLLYAIPNGGYRHPATALKMKREGQKAGVPDLCLPVPRHGYAALYIEMKRGRTSRISEAQRVWHDELNRVGNVVKVCRSYDEAVDTAIWYLS